VNAPNRFCLLLAASIASLFCSTMQALAQNEVITIIGVSRDDAVFSGGLSCCERTKQGSVTEKPIARLTPNGDWESLTSCSSDAPSSCEGFQREFLNQSRTYTVISSDGKGALIAVPPGRLGDCYDYDGSGTYSAAEIENTAVAASSPDLFEDSSPPQPLNNLDAKPILNAIASHFPNGLDSALYFKFFSLTLGGQNFVLAKRSLADYTGSKDAKDLQLIFAIGTMKDGQFQIVQWKQNTEDEDERLLGTIRLRSGRDFLLTSVSDPEGQWFRVYGVRSGKLEIVFSGGRSSC
jgi:hypothetical protein